MAVMYTQQQQQQRHDGKDVYAVTPTRDMLTRINDEFPRLGCIRAVKDSRTTQQGCLRSIMRQVYAKRKVSAR